MSKESVPRMLGVKLSKLDESRLMLAAALAGTTKSNIARQAINEAVATQLRQAAAELIVNDDDSGVGTVSEKETAP